MWYAGVARILDHYLWGGLSLYLKVFLPSWAKYAFTNPQKCLLIHLFILLPLPSSLITFLFKHSTSVWKLCCDINIARQLPAAWAIRVPWQPASRAGIWEGSPNSAETHVSGLFCSRCQIFSSLSSYSLLKCEAKGKPSIDRYTCRMWQLKNNLNATETRFRIRKIWVLHVSATVATQICKQPKHLLSSSTLTDASHFALCLHLCNWRDLVPISLAVIGLYKVCMYRHVRLQQSCQKTV